MTEDEKIQQEIDRRLASESEPAKPADVKNPSRENWQSYNPGADYDQAMKARESSPANAMAVDEADPYAKLAAAEKAAKDESDKNKSRIPGVETAKETYSQLPEDVKPYALGAAGYVAGKALRAALPQKEVFGTPEYREVQAERRSLAESEKPAIQKANEILSTLQNSQEQHKVRGSILDAQRLAAEQSHAANLAELQRAQAQHAHAQTLNLDEELARRQGPGGIPLPAPTPQAPGLTRQPVGGEGTFNYATKFGATPEEASRVPSMSVMQQENIPQQAKALGTIERVAPGFQSFKESPLLLGPEGQKAVSEREAARIESEQTHQTKEALHRQKMASALAHHKAESQMRLERAHEAAKASAKAAAEAHKAHAAHQATPPTTPAQKAALDASRDTAFDIQNRVKQNAPGMLARIGTKVAPRFIPGVGAAFAPIEAAAAKKAFDEKNYGRAAIHGLGSLGALAQATGYPPLMGAGDIAQIPAAGLAIYDLANAPEKEK